MKILTKLSILITLLFATNIFAQTIHQTSIGPFFSFKGGVNGSYIPVGRQNEIAINVVPDFGVSYFMPLSQTKDLGLSCDLAYSSYIYKIKNFSNSEVFKHRYSYISLAPSFHWSYLSMGFNFGYPVSADYGPTIDVSKLNFLVEFRLCGMYPLMEDEKARLNIFIQAGYLLTGLFKDFGKDDPLLLTIPAETENISNKFNPRPVSLSIGLNYLFSIGNTE